MSQLNKNPNGSKSLLPANAEIAKPLNTFNVQANRLTSRNETYLKIAGAFKIEVENNGNVDVIIFGNYKLPSYSKKTFGTDDSLLVFQKNIDIQYPTASPVDKIDILLTTYTK